MRDFLQPLLSGIADERSLALFFVLHFVGVHWLTGARRWWTKAPGAICLAASFPYWLQALKFSPSMLGVNAVTMSLLAGLVVLVGLWLFLTGAGALEVLSGFLLSVGGAALAMVSTGHRWPAIACGVTLVPAGCAVHWFSTSAKEGQGGAPVAERTLSAVASSALAVAIAVALTKSAPTLSAPSEPRPRLRDFVTQPATALVLFVGVTVSASAFVRLRLVERDR